MPEAVQRGNRLRQNRGKCCSKYTHVKRKHKEKIQHNIGNGRKHHGDERNLAVSDRAEQCHHKVIENRDGASGQDCSEIHESIRHHILRRLQKDKQPPHQKQAERCDHDSDGKADIDRHGNLFPQLFCIVCTKRMRNTDAKATRQSDGKADNQKMNGACVSNCGKRRISDSFSDNHGIHEAVKLLEQISDQNGQEKLKNQFHAVPSCHIICCVLHGIFSTLSFLF